MEEREGVYVYRMLMILLKFPVKQTLTNTEAKQSTAGGHFDHFTSD